jgi:hypothetical protein
VVLSLKVDDSTPILAYETPSRPAPEHLSRRFVLWAACMPWIIVIVIALLTSLAHHLMGDDEFQHGGLRLFMILGIIAFFVWPILLVLGVYGPLRHTLRVRWPMLLFLLDHLIAFVALLAFLVSQIELYT